MVQAKWNDRNLVFLMVIAEMMKGKNDSKHLTTLFERKVVVNGNHAA